MFLCCRTTQREDLDWVLKNSQGLVGKEERGNKRTWQRWTKSKYFGMDTGLGFEVGSHGRPGFSGCQ